MADLETTGTKALEEIKGFLPEVDNARRAFEEADRTLDDTRKEFDAAWEKVEAAGRALLDQLKKDQGDTASEHGETLQAVAALKAAIVEMEQEARSKFEDAQEDIQEFVEKTKALEPLIEQSFDELKETAAALRDRAKDIEQAMDSTVKEAAQFLSEEIKADFEKLQEEVQQRSQELQDFVRSQAVPAVQKEVEEFGNTLQEFQQGLQEVMERAGERTHAAAQDALQSYLEQHSELINKLVETVQATQKVFLSIKEVLDTGGEAVGEGMDLVKEGTDTTAVGLNLVIETLNELKELFSRFGFVKF